MVESRLDIRSGIFVTELRDRLTKGWHFARCVECGREFFARRPRDCCLDVRLRCAADYGFIARRSHVGYRSPADVLAVARAVTSRLGFTEAPVANVVGAANDTFFAIAGVQVFDAVLRGVDAPTRTPYFVPQPSVRVKSLDKVGRRPGISSSFVNLCTEELNGSLSDYVRHLDGWFAVFGELGMDSDGLTLIVEPEPKTRGAFEFRTVNVNYFGFELGEAIILAATDESAVRTILDFGFGFERIVWAVNEIDSYFGLIGTPSLALSGRHRLVDFVRTMTLLAAAGLTGGNQGPGYVLRKLGRLAVAEGARDVDVEPLVEHSHAHWRMFVPPRVDLADCVSVVVGELHRAANATIAASLRLRPNRIDLNQPTDSFLADLLLQHGIRHERLREALQP